MALHSSANHGHDSRGPFDLQNPRDYPILLGKSLKESPNTNDRFISLRYNWLPDQDSSKQKGIITEDGKDSQKSYKLVLDDPAVSGQQFRYAGQASSPSTISRDGADNSNSQMALFFDKAKSAFVLELISNSLDFNLTSAPGQSSRDVRAHAQISAEDTDGTSSGKNGVSSTSEDEDSAPDAENPYDFRHFLSEARENADKGTNPAGGSRTPIPGSRTPVAGKMSPVPGSTKTFHSSSGSIGSAFRSTPSMSTVAKKSREDNHLTLSKNAQRATPRSHPTSAPSQKKKAGPTKRKEAASIPLSKEHISSSEDESSEQEETREPVPTHRNPSPSTPKHPAFLHSRTPSATQFSRSPHIVLDDPSGLEIDMGSPPPENARNRRMRKVNPDAFSSHTGTPRITQELSRPHIQRQEPPSSYQSRQSHRNQSPEESDADADADADGDISMEDGDVEAFELGSPRTNTAVTRGLSISGSRIENSRHTQPSSGTHRRVEEEKAEDEDEEDDDLAAELEAALEEEEKNQSQPHDQHQHQHQHQHQSQPLGEGIGLGISRREDDEESEISEEE